MSRLFLGLDSSTQSLSAIVIDLETRRVIYDHSLNFDSALPKYKTQNGVLPHPIPLVKHSPPQMWVDALELVFARMKKDKVPLGQVLAVAGSGQQHGSVYLKADGTFSRPTSPIWMDSSTSDECAEIRLALGGLGGTTKATGSDTFERFTGPQIRKFARTEPTRYRDTAHIALVSSFMAGLIAGRIAPIDHGDGAGMNLMDIQRKQWHPGAVRATAEGLDRKLPPLAESWTVLGPVASRWTERYGLNARALALAWSGDNPCSVIGLGLIQPGMVAISLGTSDTLFGYMQECRTDPHGEGHVFGAPTGDYMTLICFKNGSLARERMRDLYRLDWAGFNKALASTPPGNNGGLVLPWFDAEIVPRVNRPGVHRRDLDEKDAPANCRAIIEAQMLAMRLHSRWMNVKPTRIYATGGASVNTAILQVMADVLNCPVLRIEVAKSAALGAALRAAHGFLRQSGEKAEWPAIVKGFSDPVPDSEMKPNAAAARVYDGLAEKYVGFEQETLGRVG